MKIKVSTGLSNHYGEVIAIERDGKFFLQLGNWDAVQEKEISKKLFMALVDEFGIQLADDSD